jgi:hypothetical protein
MRIGAMLKDGVETITASFKTEGSITADELAILVKDSASGMAGGQAGGWSMVVTRPGYKAKAETIHYWCFSAHRLEQDEPTTEDLMFIQGFIRSLGGPDVAGVTMAPNSWYWTWAVGGN